MAFKTGRHRDVKIMLSDSDWIVVLTGCKFQGMHETVVHFIKIFKINIFWTVTRVTGRYFVMR